MQQHKYAHMQKPSITQAHIALAQRANSRAITVQQLQQALGDASVTFAQLLYATTVQLAAAHKAQNIQKVTRANVILCSNIAAHTSVYANKVRKTAAAIASNNAQAVSEFTAQSNYFAHTDCYSIVVHKQHTDKFYLYAIYNNSASVYMHEGNVVSKQHVAHYCTPSAAKALLQEDSTVHNKTHNIKHTVHVRTIALSNLIEVRVRKQLLTV